MPLIRSAPPAASARTARSKSLQLFTSKMPPVDGADLDNGDRRRPRGSVQIEDQASVPGDGGEDAAGGAAEDRLPVAATDVFRPRPGDIRSGRPGFYGTVRRFEPAGQVGALRATAVAAVDRDLQMVGGL